MTPHRPNPQADARTERAIRILLTLTLAASVLAAKLLS